MMSLHTAYRPKKLKDVLGQDHVTRSLERVVADQRAHAFIFSGPSGTGKTTISRILANEFAGGVATEANIEEVPAADNTGVEDMRRLIASSYRRAIGKSPIKSIILDECHRLSGAAWDVLLKATEEPPNHVYWMFCTTNPGKIPKTMQTRCLKFALKAIDDLLIYDLLVRVAKLEKLQISEEVIEAVAEASMGSPREALVGLETCLACKTANEAREAMRSAIQSAEAVNLAKFLLNGKGLNWAEAMRHVKALEGFDAESIRIAVTQYLSAVLMSTRGDDKAAKLLSLLGAFDAPYNQSDRFAPLLISIGLALNLDQP